MASCQGEPAPTSPAGDESPAREPVFRDQPEDVPFRVPSELRLGIVGFWGSSEHSVAFEPMVRFLSERIGMPVTMVSASKYDDLVELLRSGELDLGLLPPLVYVNASREARPPRLLRTMVVEGSINYSGYLVVRADSPISHSNHLHGKRVAFVEHSSASGYLFPLHWLIQEGLDPDAGSLQEVFLGSHEEVIRAVIERRADAGATFHGGLKSARVKGMDTGLLRVLAITGRIPLDALVAAHDLDPDLLEAIDAAFDDINTTTTRGREALFGIDVHGWLSTSDDLYDPVREVVDSVRASRRDQP